MNIAFICFVLLAIIFIVVSIFHRILSDCYWYRQWVGGTWYNVRDVFTREDVGWRLYPDKGIGRHEVVAIEHLNGRILKKSRQIHRDDCGWNCGGTFRCETCGETIGYCCLDRDNINGDCSSHQFGKRREVNENVKESSNPLP